MRGIAINISVCLYVFVSARIFKNRCINFTKLLEHVFVVLARFSPGGVATHSLCTASFVDDIMLAHDGQALGNAKKAYAYKWHTGGNTNGRNMISTIAELCACTLRHPKSYSLHQLQNTNSTNVGRSRSAMSYSIPPVNLPGTVG